MMAASLEGGFADTPIDAAHAFRAIMTALARPGQIERVVGARPPAPLSAAAGAVLLTLCGPETPVFLAPSHDNQAVRGWIGFYTGAPISEPVLAEFAVGEWADLPLERFRAGTPDYPDRSATLIVEMEALAAEGVVLTGPGIESEARLSLPDRAAFQANAANYPLGLDFFFTCGDRIAGLPRSTRVA
ncbi:MAG: phosphonate C-P lyase system protein PhnH [Pseudomonadota bacterium]